MSTDAIKKVNDLFACYENLPSHDDYHGVDLVTPSVDCPIPGPVGVWIGSKRKEDLSILFSPDCPERDFPEVNQLTILPDCPAPSYDQRD